MANYNLTQTGDEVQAYIDSIPVIDVTGTLNGSTISFGSNPYSQIAANYAADCGSIVRLTVGTKIYIVRISGYDGANYTGSVKDGDDFVSLTIGSSAASGSITSPSFSTGEALSDVGIDATPTQGSDNLVKSGGVWEEVSQLGQEVDGASYNGTNWNGVLGRWINNNGVVGTEANSSLRRYDPIEVEEGVVFTYSCAMLGHGGLTYIIADENDNILASSTEFSGTITCPANSAKLYLTSAKTGLSCSVKGLSYDVGELKKDRPRLSEYPSNDLQIVDGNGNVLAVFYNGHFKTLNFDSFTNIQELQNKAGIGNGDSNDLKIVDDSGNILAEFSDGHFRTSNFDSQNEECRLSSIESTISGLIPPNYQYQYSGEKIRLNGNGFNSATWKTFSGIPMVQSFATYDDYIVFVYGAPNYGSGSLWRISTAEKLADLTFPHGTYNAPHGNVANFSNTFASGNTDLPLLYVSQWDNEGGCFVYDIRINGTCNLVQTIMTDGNMGESFGLALGDWVVDAERGFLYSAKYKVSAYHASGNGMMFCKFSIPSTATSSVVLTASDILDSFEISDDVADLTITQDKVIKNGRMFIVSGYGSTNNAEYPATLYSIDLLGHKVASFINIDQVHSSEPEGMEVYDGKILYGFGGTTIYSLTF